MNIFDRPTSKELLEAVLGFVNEEIESNDYTKDNRFKFLIVMNVLNIVKREVNLGRKIDESFFNKGLDLLKEDNFSVKKISEKIRNEELSIEDQPLLDFLYDLVARYRYKFFGKKLKCSYPNKILKSKILS